MAAWDDVLTEQDKAMFAKANMGGGAPMGAKPALLVVDMTYGFVDSKFRLGYSETGYPAVAATQRVLHKAREKGLPVIYTKGYEEPLASGKGLWKGGTPKTAEENTIVEQVAPLASEGVLQKRRPSAFFGTNLVDMLIYHGIDSLIITGLTTSGCVRATVVDAFSYNYKVVVPEECVADRSQISHKVSLLDFQMKYANVMKVDEVIEWLA
jgi:maleamate amidohydrolase